MRTVKISVTDEEGVVLDMQTIDVYDHTVTLAIYEVTRDGTAIFKNSSADLVIGEIKED